MIGISQNEAGYYLLVSVLRRRHKIFHYDSRGFQPSVMGYFGMKLRQIILIVVDIKFGEKATSV